MPLLSADDVISNPDDSSEEGRRVYFVSLGCPKNRVDSEVMLGSLAGKGYRVVQEPSDADVLVVNTCSFVDEAKEESVDTILEMADVKAKGQQKLIVSGCLAQRYADELTVEMPEVDLFIGTGEYHRIADLLQSKDMPKKAVERPYYVADHNAPRVLTTPSFTAYTRIAEGCSQRCTFCIIPRLRGKARSRAIESVAAEVEELAAKGVVEFNLIAQDLTHYGDDLKDGQTNLALLLKRLVQIDGVRWIRLLYCYPHNFTDDLIEVIATEKKVCSYVDIPLQHIHDDMLKRMQRRTTESITRDLVGKLRQIDDLVIRTTFIVGHPGEQEPHFRALYDFVEEYEFDRVGVFKYSQEEGTKSARQADQVAQLVKVDRYHRLMELQQAISARRMADQVGRTVEVLVEGLSDESDLVLQGRTYGQAPDVDGQTFFGEDRHGALPGEIRLAEIIETSEYDFMAKILPR